jgi:hypothetical protein
VSDVLGDRRARVPGRGGRGDEPAGAGAAVHGAGVAGAASDALGRGGPRRAGRGAAADEPAGARGIGGSARLTEHSAHDNRQKAAHLQQRAAGLRAEAQLREALDPGINRIEDDGRQAPAQRQAEAEQVARQAETGDPGTGTTAVIEPDGWRAVVPPSSSTGIAARLLYWNAEIKDGRGDDATDSAAQALLDGLSATELREIADELGASARGARTKPQLVDKIVNMAIGSPRNNRALRQL